MKWEHAFIPYTKVNSKRPKDLNKKKHHKAPKSIGETFSDISHSNVFLNQSPMAIENKQMGPNQTYKLLHSKGNYKQNEKTYRLGENICKWCDQ